MGGNKLIHIMYIQYSIILNIVNTHEDYLVPDYISLVLIYSVSKLFTRIMIINDIMLIQVINKVKHLKDN